MGHIANAASQGDFGLVEKLAFNTLPSSISSIPEVQGAIQQAMQVRRRSELAEIPRATHHPDYQPGLEAWSCTLWYADKSSAEGSNILRLSRVGGGTVEGTIDWPHQGIRSRIVGYYDGNHILFKEHSILLGDETQTKNPYIYRKYSLYIVGMRVYGFSSTGPVEGEQLNEWFP